MALLTLLIGTALAQMGSPGGGETQAIALHPTDGNILYVGAAKGLCKTTRGGKDNWPSTGLENVSPRVIALDPANPDTIYAGTYEMGVYKSSDAAKHWTHASHGIANLRVRALVALPGALYAGTDGGGIFRSTNGAASWQEINRGLLDKVVRALAADPRNPKVLYAGTWHGVYKTEDAGEHWSADPNGLYDVDVAALTFGPDGALFAGTNPRGVYRSHDAGRTWQKGEQPLTEVIQSIAVDPGNAQHVYAGTRAGVFRSTDGGRSFKPAGLRWSNSAWTLVFDPKTTPATLYYGGVGGVLKTTDGGKWWDVTGPVRP